MPEEKKTYNEYSFDCAKTVKKTKHLIERDRERFVDQAAILHSVHKWSSCPVRLCDLCFIPVNDIKTNKMGAAQ